MITIHDLASHPCPDLHPQAVSILALVSQLFTFADNVQLVSSPTDKIISSFWALERAAHVQEAVFRLSEKLVDNPAGRVMAMQGVLCVIEAAQHRSLLLQEMSPTQAVPPQNIILFNDRTIRHMLKLLDLATLDLGGEENQSEVFALMDDSVSSKRAAVNVCSYLHLAISTGAVTGGLVKEIFFSPGLTKIVTEYSAGDMGGDGEYFATVILFRAIASLRFGTDVAYASETRATVSVSHAEGMEMMRRGISAESLRSFFHTMMEAARQAAAAWKLQDMPLTSRSKAIQKALKGGYLQVSANCTLCLVSFHHSLTASSSFQKRVLCYLRHARTKPGARAES